MELVNMSTQTRSRNKGAMLPVFYILVGTAALFIAVRTMFPQYSALRFVVYTLPIVGFAFFVGRMVIHANIPFNTGLIRNYLLPFFALELGIILVSFFVLAFQDNLFERFFRESFFLIVPLLSMIFIYIFAPPNFGQSRTLPRFFFVILIISYSFEINFAYGDALTAVMGDALTASQLASGESLFAFVFGLFFLFFLGRRDYIFSVIALVLVFASFKRIVIYSAILCAIIYFVVKAIPPLWSVIKRLAPIGGVIGNVIIALILVNFALGAFDDAILDATGQNANQFSLGRRAVQGAVVDYYQIDAQPSFLVNALGFAATTEFIQSNDFGLNNFHSDILRLLIEIGFPLFIIFVFVFYRLHVQTIEIFVLALFINSLWISDNTFIYFEVWFTFFLLVIILKATELQQDSTSQTVNGSTSPQIASK
jgi:hypothetical protein